MAADRELLALRGADGGEGRQLDQQHEAQQDQQRRREGPRIGQRQLAQAADAPDRHMHEDQPDQPARRVHHHDDEQHADIEQPGIAEQADAALQQHHHDGAEDRPEEAAGAADIDGEQRIGRLGRRHGVEGDDLVDQHVQPAADAGEEARQGELQQPHHARVVADELGALEIVAGGVGHAAERRLGLQPHQGGGDEGPGEHQAVDLPRRGVADAEQAGVHHAIDADAAFAAEEAHEHQRRGRDQLAQPHRDHGEGGGALLGHQPAEDIAEEHAAEPAGQRHQLGRQPDRAGLHQVHDMRRAIGAQPEQHGMAERQQARLAHQHVVAQREDRHHADLAHQASARSRNGGPCSSRRTGTGTRAGRRAPAARANGGAACSCVARPHQPARPEHQDQHHHQERQQRADPRQGDGEDLGERRARGHDEAEFRQQVRQRHVEHHGEGLDQPHQDRGDEAAGQRTQPAEHHDDEDDRPHGEGHRGLGDLVVAADHAGEPGQRRAGGEHEGEDARHVVAERRGHVGMGQRRLDHQADAGAGQAEPDRAEHQRRDQQHEGAIGREIACRRS